MVLFFFATAPPRWSAEKEVEPRPGIIRLALCGTQGLLIQLSPDTNNRRVPAAANFHLGGAGREKEVSVLHSRLVARRLQSGRGTAGVESSKAKNLACSTSQILWVGQFPWASQ